MYHRHIDDARSTTTMMAPSLATISILLVALLSFTCTTAHALQIRDKNEDASIVDTERLVGDTNDLIDHFLDQHENEERKLGLFRNRDRN